jgi:hypothetical protein
MDFTNQTNEGVEALSTPARLLVARSSLGSLLCRDERVLFVLSGGSLITVFETGRPSDAGRQSVA